jgi:hypothetical protein
MARARCRPAGIARPRAEPLADLRTGGELDAVQEPSDLRADAALCHQPMTDKRFGDRLLDGQTGVQGIVRILKDHLNRTSVAQQILAPL